MDPKYVTWIATYLSRVGSPRGRCVAASAEMRQAFSELTEVRGWYGQTEHCWLTTPDGTIVDPTVAQFGEPLPYRTWKPGDEVRVGRCLQCGDDIYRRVKALGGATESICGRECEEEFARVYESE